MPRFLNTMILVVLVVSLIPGGAVPRAQAEEDVATLCANLPSAHAFTVAPGQIVRETHDGTQLHIGAAALAATTTISITSLCDAALPLLDPGMTNVTAGPRRGFRFLPHMQFQDQIEIRTPYDRSLIPPGHSEDDIRTFYFDETLGGWQELELVEVDKRTHEIVSRSDHFTDMINATVSVPDSPQAEAFDQNSIGDMEAATAGDGMTLIEPPLANSSGDTQISYPIELPPGRTGMAPSLQIAYSAAAGNGWLGLGWDLAMEAVTIDTRWGAPRFYDDLESETYLLNGAQLAPIAHRGDLQPRQADRVFNQRVEGSFQRIVRHGDHPSNYWWEVTVKDGRRFIYGDPAGDNPNDPATLRDASGRIAYWALREMVDLNGNRVRYSYERVYDLGLAAGEVQGVDLYPTSINYTADSTNTGAFTVRFRRDSQLPGYVRRPDVRVDGRSGFKRVTAELLKRIEVEYRDSLVRAYELAYREGAFHKTLLASITQYGADGAAFHTHTFDYYDTVRNESGAYNGFEGVTDWVSDNDSLTWSSGTFVNELIGPALTYADVGRASALGSATVDGLGGHLYLGFNPGPPLKPGSAGFKVGFTQSTSEGLSALVDLNGDGLADKVIRPADGEVYVRLNQSGPNGVQRFGDRIRIATLNRFAREESSTVSAGAEAYLAVNAFLNLADTTSTESVYFSDVNGDGLPDLVDGGNVLFNYLQDGVPTFVVDSSLTPAPIADVDPTTIATDTLLADFEALFQQQVATFPLHDTVRRWVAPLSGTVAISGDVDLVEDASGERAEYDDFDGVRVAIQHNGAELWNAALSGDEATPLTPTNVTSIDVQAGDRIYFRVGSIFDGNFDQVAWSPEIRYLSFPATNDANGLDQGYYNAAADFAFAGRRDIDLQLPVAGTVRLVGDLQKQAVTSDDITLLVQHNGQTIISESLSWDQTGPIALGQEIVVQEGDSLRLRVQVDSPIDVAQIDWTPQLVYIAVDDPNQTIVDDQGNFIFTIDPPYDIDLYPISSLAAPQQAWVAPQAGQLTVRGSLSAADPSVGGQGVFTVKGAGELLSKAVVAVGGTAEVTVAVAAGDLLFFDFSVADPDVGRAVSVAASVHFNDPANPESVPSALHRGAAPDELGANLFAQPYRGWAYVGYNGNDGRAELPIDESRLVIDVDAIADACDDPDPATTTCNPTGDPAYPFTPVPGKGIWQGPDLGGYVGPATISSARLGADRISVPLPGELAGRAVSRLSVGEQTSVGAGVSYLSGSVSLGESAGVVDYVDLNGDSYPDIVGNGHVQYTTPNGGIEGFVRPALQTSALRASDNRAENFGIGGNPAAFFFGGDGDVDTDNGAPPQAAHTDSQLPSLNLSIGIGIGESTPRYDMLDMNGDGLPDQVFQQSDVISVALNLGYSFAAPEEWGSALINDGSSTQVPIDGSLGFNDGIYSYGGGLSLNRSDSETATTLADINGDGLLDRVAPVANGLRVAFNTGAGFAAPQDWLGASFGSAVATSSYRGLEGGAFFTYPAGPLCWPFPTCYIIINPGASISRDLSRQDTQLRDIDGDGYADYLSSDSDDLIAFSRNRTDETNLLKTVYRPMSARFDLRYERSGNTEADPHSRWVLAEVALFDGLSGDGVDTQLVTYRYEGGFYDRQEREFYGYGRVIEEQRDVRDGSLYRSVTYEHSTADFYTRGLLLRMLTSDGQGNPFVEVIQEYLLRDVASGAEPAAGQGAVGAIFPQLARVETRSYEGGPVAGQQTEQRFSYDALGNNTQLFDSGDPSSAADDLSITIGYAACPSSYVVGVPNAISVVSDGRLHRERASEIDCATGNITQVREYLADGSAAITDLAYFADGNLRQVVGPSNSTGQRYSLSYTYDSDVATYVDQVSDIFGYSSQTSFDVRFGRSIESLDINGNRISTSLDQFGRVTAVVGPYEQGSGQATISFAYHPEATVPWALTQHIDSYRNPADPIEIATFNDGLQRVVQTKRDGTVHTGVDTAPQDVMLVSGRVIFDQVGRVVEEFYPTSEPVGTAGVFNPDVDSVPTRTVFDILDRPLQRTLPDTTAISMRYGFGQHRDGSTQLETILTDPNGVESRSYQNMRELLVGVRQHNRLPDGTSETIWTSYQYDGLDQLTAIVDDANNATSYEYDNFGRRVAFTTPDTGRTEQRFDLASNLIATRTPNLRVIGAEISYSYDIIRPIAISYPQFPENNVRYSYGEPGAAFNRAGRLTLVEDGSGTTERFYGPLGEIVKEIRTINSATQGSSDNGPEVYTTSYTYDTFGRLQNMVYPDGELLTYAYDAGGRMRAAYGEKGTFSYSYLERLEYDEFEDRVFMQTGNGVRSQYSYRSDNRRLASMTAGNGEGNLFQNLTYSYDNAGNILSVANDVAVSPAAQMGGPVSQQFSYDDLYRLTAASGSYEYTPGFINRYSLAMSYDTLHNIRTKDQLNETVNSSGTAVRQQKTSYNWLYDYAGPQPHAPTHIGERSFSYDANGNQTGWTHDVNGTRRTVVFDEANRVHQITDNGQQLDYIYNADGERVIKRGPQGETVYVNPYFVIRNREVGTKHIYAGSSRLVSKLMLQDKPGGSTNGKEPFERDQYFYHSDHLGGANYVTDTNGRLYQHLEYFPFGETWVEEATNTQRTPYLFTGKELDEETGLYYYGARYYDPRVSQFISADPLYSAEPEQGLTQPQLYNLYAYAINSPVAMLDPDGRDTIIAYGPRDKKFTKAVAEQLAKDIRARVSGEKVHVVPFAKVDSTRRAIAKAKRTVSTAVFVGHGAPNQLEALPKRGMITVEKFANRAGVANEGLVVVIGCFAVNGFTSSEKNLASSKDITSVGWPFLAGWHLQKVDGKLEAKVASENMTGQQEWVSPGNARPSAGYGPNIKRMTPIWKQIKDASKRAK